MQGDLLSWSPPDRVESRREPDSKPTIEARFSAFHAANPHVFAEMLRLARVKLDGGATFVSVKKLWEDLRESLRVRKLDGFKLNNDYTSMYARACIEAEPRLVGVIELRRRKAK